MKRRREVMKRYYCLPSLLSFSGEPLEDGFEGDLRRIILDGEPRGGNSSSERLMWSSVRTTECLW